MRLKLLLSVFTISSVFSQNIDELSSRSQADLYDSNTNSSAISETVERSYDPVNTGSPFFVENEVSKTAKSSALERHRLWLNMTNTGGAFKQILVGYIQGATNGLDNNYDGLSLDANPYLDFYSVISSSNLVIQGRALPFTVTDEVPLGYRTTITGDFTIAIDHADGSLLTQAIFLEDKVTNTIHDLRVSGYTFATTSGIFKNRFVLRYQNQSLGALHLDKEVNHVSVWINNESINVSSTLENIDKVFVYNISGKLLYTDDSIVTNEIVIHDIEPNNEILLMKIVLKNNHIESKKIIH